MQTPEKMQAFLQAAEELRVAAEAEKEQLTAPDGGERYWRTYAAVENAAKEVGITEIGRAHV